MATDLLIDSFRNYLRFERNYSECTVIAYVHDLESFKEFVQTEDEGIDWEHVDADLIRRWIEQLMEKGYTPSSVNRKLSSLRTFYKLLMCRGEVRVSPLTGLRGPKKKKPLPYVVKEEDMDRLLDDVDFGEGFKGLRDKAVIEMFYATGVRLSELVGLNDGDVDFSALQVKVLGKRNKQRVVPFGNELRDTLRAYVNSRDLNCECVTGAFFVNDAGARISRTKIRTLVRKHLSKVVRMKKRSPHVLRHSFATSMLNNEADLNVVKELLGHDSLAATEIYTHMTFEKLKEVYNQAHPRA